MPFVRYLPVSTRCGDFDTASGGSFVSSLSLSLLYLILGQGCLCYIHTPVSQTRLSLFTYSSPSGRLSLFTYIGCHRGFLCLPTSDCHFDFLFFTYITHLDSLCSPTSFISTVFVYLHHSFRLFFVYYVSLTLTLSVFSYNGLTTILSGSIKDVSPPQVTKKSL